MLSPQIAGTSFLLIFESNVLQTVYSNAGMVIRWVKRMAMVMRTRAIAELLAGVSGRSYSRGFTEGLHAAQWEALRYFARANESARTVTAFAVARGSTQGTATQTVAALVKKGLLTRRARADDRRSTRLDVSERGRELLASDPLQHLIDVLSRLSADDREALAQGLIALHEQLQRSEA